MLWRHCASHISSLVCTCLYICDFEGKWRIFIILFNCLIVFVWWWSRCHGITRVQLSAATFQSLQSYSSVTISQPIRDQYCVTWPATDQSETSIQSTVMLQSDYLSSLISCRLCHCLTRVNIRYGEHGESGHSITTTSNNLNNMYLRLRLCLHLHFQLRRS